MAESPRVTRPSFAALAAIAATAYGAPSVALARVSNAWWAAPLGLAFGSCIAVLGVGRHTCPRGLWRAGGIAVGAGAAFIAALATVGFLQGSHELAFAWAPAAVVAGVRPVLEVFRQERGQPRLDSTDVFFTTGGAWVLLAGFATLATRGWIVGGLTLAAGGALALHGLVQEHARLRWLRQVAAGEHEGWRLDEREPGSPLLDVVGASSTDYTKVLVHTPTGGGRYREIESQPQILGALAWIPEAPTRGARLAGWTVAISVCTMVVLLTTASCALLSPWAAVAATVAAVPIVVIGVAIYSFRKSAAPADVE